MDDDNRYDLLHGPYMPPACRVGDTLACEYRGREVKIGGMSDGLIQWPVAKKAGKRSLIVCGDLIRAVRVESNLAIQHHFGVSATLVTRWRRALDADRYTEGTMKLRRDEFLGRPVEMQSLAPREWTEDRKDRLRESIRQSPSWNCWAPEEDALFAGLSNREIAGRLGRTIKAVRSRRTVLRPPSQRRGIRPPGWWREEPIRSLLLGDRTAADLARELDLDPSLVARMRRCLRAEPESKS